MPISIEIVGARQNSPLFDEVFEYFQSVDDKFSTYKPDSEISKINRGLPSYKWSPETKLILDLCEQTKRQTNGYFDINNNGQIDPSGLVKGWSVREAAAILKRLGAQNFYIDAGGDIQVSGTNDQDELWAIGIRNPFNRAEIIKTVLVGSEGVATSGTAIRGQHIYNPKKTNQIASEVVSLTVIGPDIYEADRFATAAFAMGRSGIAFIEALPRLEGYMVMADKNALMSSGFERYTPVYA